jgi:hypothetical protein
MIKIQTTRDGTREKEFPQEGEIRASANRAHRKCLENLKVFVPFEILIKARYKIFTWLFLIFQYFQSY